MRCDGSRRNVESCRGEFAGNLVHVRDHEQQALRGRECSRERAGLKRAMNRSGSAAFALHFHDMRDAAPDVRDRLGRPLIRPLSHRRGGSDGIDRDHFVDAISNVCDRLIGVHGLELTFH